MELVGYEDEEAGRSLRLQSWEVHGANAMFNTGLFVAREIKKSIINNNRPYSKEELIDDIADYLRILKANGEISYFTYLNIFDLVMITLDDMYKLGRQDAIKSMQNPEESKDG